MNVRKALMASIAAAVLAGIASCGGGGGGTTTYTVGGNVAGSVGTVTLQINGGNSLAVPAAGNFTFTAALASGATYTVTVSSAAQNCAVANGAGTMGAANITNVTITCTTVVRSASLSGAQENPAVTTAATGRGAVVVNPTTLEITGGMTFSGLTPSAGGHHIHQAPAGNPTGNGPVIIGFTLAPDGLTAIVPAGTVLTAGQYASLLAGELYFNVHTAANPGGEIRGQITVQGGVTAGLAALTGAQENATNTSTATGRGTIVFDSATRAVLIAYVTHNVTNTTVAHIHTGPVGGPPGPADVVTLTQGTSIYTAPNPSTLTAQNVTDLNAGNTYFNVHSTNNSCPPAANCALGEIRGQIAVQ
ncbi:MAG: CHRD domain-containing protein [Burkholderiaceae bacterium]